jgi:hypothetical protein
LTVTLGCSRQTVTQNKADKFYFLHFRQGYPNADTVYLDSLDRNDPGLTKVYQKYFDGLKIGVTKLVYDDGPPDVQFLDYYTEEFGVVYTKNIHWGNFGRLHSTNDSIEKVLNTLIDHILSSQSLVLAGEYKVVYADSVIDLYPIRHK